MPKKKAAKKTASKKKSAARPAAAQASEHTHEFTLDPVEEKAFHLAQSSTKLQRELEEAVTQAMAGAVRKVFQNHRVELTQDQALEMAMILFGD